MYAEKKAQITVISLIEKMTTIIPTLRDKKRYILFEVISDGAVSMRETSTELQSTFEKNLGTFTLARAGVQFLPDWQQQRGILRVSHLYVDDIKASMVFVASIKGKKAVVQTLSVSGILNKVRTQMNKKENNDFTKNVEA